MKTKHNTDTYIYIWFQKYEHNPAEYNETDIKSYIKITQNAPIPAQCTEPSADHPSGSLCSVPNLQRIYNTVWNR